MSERLTKRFNGGYGLVNVKDDEQDVESKFPNTLQAILDSFDQLGKIEDALFDASGNEVISLDRLRELASAEREGRLVVLPCKVGDVVAWDNGAGTIFKLWVKGVYHLGKESRLLLKDASGKWFDAEPLSTHPNLRYGAEAAAALASKSGAGEGAE